MSKTPAVNPFAKPEGDASAVVPAPAAPTAPESQPAAPESPAAVLPPAVVLPPPPTGPETAPVATVRMVRSKEISPNGPWTADVHPSEVKNYSNYGWNVAE